MKDERALVVVSGDEPVVSTEVFAAGFEITHQAVMKIIDRYLPEFEESEKVGFQIRPSRKNQSIRFAFLTEEQAAFLGTLLRNTRPAVAFKRKLTREFFRIRRTLAKVLAQKQNAEWLEQRKAGKVTRRQETDTIKRFVEYATGQGSQNAERYYCNISKMQNQALFFLEQKFPNIREALNLHQLSVIVCADQIVAPLQVGDQAGYKDATGPKFLPYANNLEQTAEGRIRSNLARTVQEGYNADYLKELAAQGIDPLKEAYTDALNQAGADYNRLGLRGSGFELGRKYGSQDDSITKGYLDAVGDVTRNVALAGAEAAREDRFRNAGLQDQALGMAQALSGTQSNDQFRRLSGDLSQGQADEGNRQWWAQFDQGTQLANKDLLGRAGDISMQQDRTNEANRQGWWDRSQAASLANSGLAAQGLDALTRIRNQDESNRQGWWDRLQAASLANSGLAAQGLDALTRIRNQDESNRQYWNEDALKRQQLDKSNILQGVQQLANLDQTDEANRQWWANTLEGQQKYDDANRLTNWQTNLDLLKWMANRDDEAAKANLANQMTIDQKNILDTPQQGITNLLNFIGSQSNAAGNQQQNYWNAFNAQNLANQNAAAQQGAIGNMFASVFQPATRAPVAPQPSAMQSFTNLLTNPFSTVKSWF